MNGRKLWPRLLVSIAALTIVVIIVYYACPQPRETTFGTFATKEPGQPAGPVKLSNCVGGKQYGRFLVIPAPNKLRHTVVFALTSDRPLGQTETVLTGYCEGIANFEIPGCPALPPFLLVTNAYPVAH